MSKDWEKVKLDEICVLNQSNTGNKFSFDEIEYIDISSVGEGVLLDTQKMFFKDAPSRAKRLVRNGSTILSTVRPNRRSFLYVKNPKPNVIVSTGFAVLDPLLSKVSSRFLYYVVTNQSFTDYLTANAKGAAYPAVDTEIIKRADIIVPPLATQRRIAAILSAYDELIENNSRRIKILEEMARMIYQEWFVKFRFPGHEQAKFVESPLGMIPVGWEVVCLEDICTKITDGSHWSPISVDKGYPMASVKDMHNWGFWVNECRKISFEDYGKLIKSNCKPLRNDILIAKDGSYLKHVFVVRESIEIVILSSIAILRTNERVNPDFLAMTLKSSNTIARLKGFVSGVAIPRIVLKDFRKFQVICPPISLQEKWFNATEPIFKICCDLVKKNEILKQTRDMLLPKLISGEIDVSNLDIPIEER
ncbi:MAG: restriction endonuclease subunit S [Acidobacteria bacterium]|nr:restriction endonuclease subunit S [Acidobacteriota bacterium]